MLKILLDNYRIVRQVLPHPVWFAELTGINLRVADNVLSGARKVSVRHVVSVARAFGIEEQRLQFPILGSLDSAEPMNEARRLWLCAHIARYGSSTKACQAYPGLGLKTLAKLLRPGAIVSPIMCELMARRTGWDLPPQLLHGSVTTREPELQHADALLTLIRLGRHQPVNGDALPGRTKPTAASVRPEVRFRMPSFVGFETLIKSTEVDMSVPLQFKWMLLQVNEAEASGILTESQARCLRLLMRTERCLSELRRKPQIAA